MDYTIQEFEELAVKMNGLNPYAVSIVDSYGLMHEENMMGYFNALNGYLHEDVIIGYHAHNNFNLAYANAIALVNAQNERDIILDGSLYGMGKGAGNGSIELLAYWLNTHRGSGYDVAQLLEIINLDIMEIRRKYEWGYSFDKFISASNQCHTQICGLFVVSKYR